MKKISGLILCMGMFLSGQAATYGSPPSDAGGRYETTVGPADAATLEAGYAVSIETLERVSDQVMQQMLSEHAAELARLTDVSAFTRITAELQANAVDRALVAKLIKKMKRHRWRDCSNRYARAPIDTIYRPGWNRKVCEG